MWCGENNATSISCFNDINGVKRMPQYVAKAGVNEVNGLETQ